MMSMGYLSESRINGYMSRAKTKPLSKKYKNFQAIMPPTNFKKPNLKEVVREIQLLNKNRKKRKDITLAKTLI